MDDEHGDRSNSELDPKWIVSFRMTCVPASAWVGNVLAAFFASLEIQTYLYLALCWIVTGVCLLVWQALTRRFYWSAVFFVLVICTAGVCINMAIAAEIIASV